MIATSNAAAMTGLMLLLLRGSLGAMILAHGLNKFLRGGRIPGTARWFESIGMRPGRLNALAAATTEVAAGVLLLAGLLTPIAAGAVVALMTVAIVAVHRRNGYFVFHPGQGIEYCLEIAVVAVVVATLGPGRFSLDRAIEPWRYTRLEGLLTSVVLGLGAALVQLLAVWRPPRPTAAR